MEETITHTDQRILIITRSICIIIIVVIIVCVVIIVEDVIVIIIVIVCDKWCIWTWIIFGIYIWWQPTIGVRHFVFPLVLKLHQTSISYTQNV